MVKQRTANSSLAKGGLTCFAETFVLKQTFDFRMNFGAKNPALRQAANRWLQGTCKTLKLKNVMKIRQLNSMIAIVFLLIVATNTNAQKLESEFLYKLSLTLDTSVDIGKLPIGKRVIYPINGGSFEGPKLRGKVRSFGADWVLRLDSVTTKLDVRLLLETEDGQFISNTYTGIVYNSSDGKTYWRTTPVFETSSKKYEWLNYLVAVGVGSMSKGGVSYDVYSIK